MISIIVPVYNTAAFLDECLGSIVSQDYNDWECLLIDDGSTDGSDRICDLWAKKDSRFIVFHQRNRGVSAARNNGIESSRGEFICFIDSDDWVSASYLSSLFFKAAGSNYGIVVSGIVQIDSKGREKVFIPSGEDVGVGPGHASRFVELNRFNLLYGPTSILYRRDIIDNNHLRFPDGCSYGEDLVFNYSYLNHVKCIGCVPQANYFYRLGGGDSLSTRYRPDQFETDYCQWKYLKEFYERHGMWELDSKAYLYQRLWGIIYDGIFEAEDSGNKVKEILRIPEISDLTQWQGVFPSAKWIKWAILHKRGILLTLGMKVSGALKKKSA